MSVLQPLIDKGDIAVVSGQMGMDKVGTLRWDGAVARPAWTPALRQLHRQEGPRCALALRRPVARIISSLKGVGYAPDLKCRSSPPDAEVASVKAMIAGEQYSTVFKDTRDLAKTTATMVDAVMMQGKEPEVNATQDYDNGKKVVPSNLLVRHAVGKDDIQKLLVEPAISRPKTSSKAFVIWRPRRETCGPFFSGHMNDQDEERKNRLRIHMGANQTAMQQHVQPILEMRDITKTFPGVKALTDVNLTVMPADIHAVVARTGRASRR